MRHPPLAERGFAEFSYQGQVIGDNSYICQYPKPPLSSWVQYYWQLNVPKGSYVYRSVPDNNVDCIFALNSSDQSFLILPFYSPKLFEITGPISYFGIRFRVLAQQWLTSVPVGEWGNDGISDIFGGALFDRLNDCMQTTTSFHARCDSVSQALLANLTYRRMDHRLVSFIRHSQYQACSGYDLSSRQCAEFAVSTRHLRRLCQLYLGVSPRNFNRVLRFQNTLHLMNTSEGTSVWAEYYCDQPHFIKEFKKLSGITPGEFLNSSVLYNASSHGM